MGAPARRTDLASALLAATPRRRSPRHYNGHVDNDRDTAAPRGPAAWADERLRELHRRYRRLFWTVHSVWALATGVAVLILAHHRHGYLPWVVLFLALTWASTLFFSRFAPEPVSPAGRFAQSFVSYLTRVMYQETLFFLLPFYAYSTTLWSVNASYTGLLAVLAVLSCLDLPFDRLLRTSQAFALAFFFLVTFSALQLVLPLLLRLPIYLSAELAAAAAFVGAVPLVEAPGRTRGRRLAVLCLGFLAALVGVRFLLPLIPPVPLRLGSVQFATRIDPERATAERPLGSTVSLTELTGDQLYAVVTVRSPSPQRTTLTILFSRDGTRLRRSQPITTTAHDLGIWVWDALPAPAFGFLPGTYTVEVRTAEGQLVGRKALRLVSG